MTTNDATNAIVEAINANGLASESGSPEIATACSVNRHSCLRSYLLVASGER